MSVHLKPIIKNIRCMMSSENFNSEQSLEERKYVRNNIKWIVKVTKILHFVSTLEILFSHIFNPHVKFSKDFYLTFNSSTMTSSEWGNKSCLNNNNTPQKKIYIRTWNFFHFSLSHSLTSTSVMAVTIWNEKKYFTVWWQEIKLNF